MATTALVHIIPQGGSSPTQLDGILAASTGYKCPPEMNSFGLLSSYLEVLLRLPHGCGFAALQEKVIMGVKSLVWLEFDTQQSVEGDVVVRIVTPARGHDDVYERDMTFDVRDAVATPAEPPPPAEDDLTAFVTRPPHPAFRFPVSPHLFLRLPDKNREKLFRPAKPGEKCSKMDHLVHAIIEPPVAGGSEDNFHHFWDTLLSDVLQFFYVVDTWVKERNNKAGSGILRPDLIARFGLFYALLRAEEKGPDGKGNPADEIIDKMEWTYGTSVPYILGYYATEYLVTFCSLGLANGRNTRSDIVSLNLILAEDRVECFIVCLNCSRLLTTLRDLCVSTNAVPDIVEYERPNGKRVQIFQRKVAKAYTDGRVYARLKNLYAELNQFPGSEVMIHFNDDERTLVFKRGYSSEPGTVAELQGCLTDVCNTLAWLHGRGWMHRDIRWENVVVDEGGSWLLIDYDEACRSPSPNGHRLDPATHASEMACGSHDTRVDMWSLGHLLCTCDMELPEYLKALMHRCLNSNPQQRPTAAECLEVINAGCLKWTETNYACSV